MYYMKLLYTEGFLLRLLAWNPQAQFLESAADSDNKKTPNKKNKNN
jgi:hypothetical protein